MTEHPITPPPELRRLWAQQAQRMDPKDPIAWQEHIATQAARWGSDQELEACCEWLHAWTQDKHPGGIENLRHARRPKPPSLKEQALLAIDTAVADGRLSPDVSNVVRRALEQLPE